MTSNYNPPVSALLTRGDVRHEPVGWPDYLATYGFGATHVPELIRMATDPTLNQGTDAEAWAPVHAWRALGQLRATEAIEPLIPLFDLIESDDYVPEVAEVLAMIGPAGFPPLVRHLADTSRPLYSRTLAIEAIAKLGARYPSLREDAVATLTGYLERFDSQDAELNAFLVHGLIDLAATEPDAVAVMEAAHAAGSVDEMLCGDWEDVQVELRLLPERLTPRTPTLAQRLAAASSTAHDRRAGAVSPPQSSRATKAKEKARRKMAKQSRRRNRKRH